MIGVIDLGISNIGSVMRAFQRLGSPPALLRDAQAVARAHAIVLPGVGAFGDGMAALRAKGMVGPLREAARAGTPILGFCLGMQLLADGSEEYGDHEGLGLIPGRVVRLKPAPGERVPNIGWCDVVPREGARLFHDVREGTPFYFVHSYHLQCADLGYVAATIAFGSGLVTVAVEHGNIFGLQCHPEKSQDAGLAVLDAFLSLARERTCHE
jgi:glutamine amidotransferase